MLIPFQQQKITKAITARQTKEKLIPYTEFTLLIHQFNKERGLNFVDKTNCLNCNSPLLTDYCGDCGQKKAQRISFSLLIEIMQRGIIEFKSPLIVTLVGLFINPGKVYREYLAGRRATYFNPMRYAFWLLTLSMFVAAYFNVALFNIDVLNFENEKNVFPVSKLEIMNVIQSSIVYLTFFYALICAICIKVFFRKGLYSISELYIPCLLNISQVFLILVALILLEYYNTIYGQVLYVIYSTIYFVWGISHLFQQRTWWTYLKVFFAGILSYVLFAIMTISIGYVFFGVKQGFDDAHDAKVTSEVNTIAVSKDSK